MTSIFDSSRGDARLSHSTGIARPSHRNPVETSTPKLKASRRGFLRKSLGGMFVGLTAAGVELTIPRPLAAQGISTPDAALQELMDGNRRFTSGRLTAHDHDLEILRQDLEEKQEPYAAVLSCADSRVPVEMVFDQSIGHVFVTRVAGNIATAEIVGSLEYGAAVLGTKLILVLGHANCGAVKATIKAEDVPGQISSLFPHIQPAVNQAGSNLEAATKANAKNQASLLRHASTLISDLAKQGKIKVVAGYYDLKSGSVSLLD